MVWAGQELVVRGEGQGGAKGLQKEVHMGAAEPLPVGTVAQQEPGLRRARDSMGLLSARGPGRTRAGLHLWGLLPQLALQVLRDQVGLVMLGEVVTPHEALLTLGTLEAFVPCVGAGMPLELVAPCEPLATEEPVADEGPLAGMQAHVSPQQGRLTESLATVGDVAYVLLLALLARPLVPILAVGTRAGHAAPLFPRLGLSSQGLFHLQLDLGGAQPTDGQVVPRNILHSQLLLSASVGDGDGHALDLDTVDVDGLHGLGRCCQLCCVQADDAPSRSDLWQGSFFSENCSRVLFAGPTQMGSTGRRATASGGGGSRSCCWGAVLDEDRLYLTRRRTDVDLSR